MKDIQWLVNRLKSMNVPEVAWRVQQKVLQKQEYSKYFTAHLPVTEVPLPKKLKGLNPKIDSLKINWDNLDYQLFMALNIFEVFDYSVYKEKWNAGFQTENLWPKNEFSYNIMCNQRTDIGDIRTNWELNRHFQFSALAKNYYVTGNQTYLDEFCKLFEDWNANNLFLHGVEWTSAMEVAIRVNSWIFTYSFLLSGFEKFDVKNFDLLDSISHGIKVMVNFIIKHRARFSSANNHLIVEMYAIALAGVFFKYSPWQDYAVKVLTKEIIKQNYSDGVNKEMSLHYQTFVMEAYGILITFLRRNNIEIPKLWYKYLEKMSEFVADCCGNYGETVVFGDNDEGKVLDLCGVKFDHYRYVLDLMSIVLSKRYSNLNSMHENLHWLFAPDEIDKSRKKEKYIPPISNCYKQGGYTILRSKDRKILIGIDHADLGFGKIAAHGHADALSFQLFVEGIPVLVDPGTYNYHVTPEDRDYFRRTENHNTVSVDGKDQSEMLGPFLWGKKAKCTLLDYTSDAEKVEISAKLDYGNILHIRTFTFDFNSVLNIKDKISDLENCSLNLMIHPSGIIKVQEHSTDIDFKNFMVEIQPKEKNMDINLTESKYSLKYNQFSVGNKITYDINEESFEIRIQIG